MKIEPREIAFSAVGFVIGALVAALLTTTALWLVYNSATQSVRQAGTTTQRCFDTLLAATAANDYDQFVSLANDRFRSRISPITFQSISQSLTPRMQRGYTPTYLGQLRQNGAQVSLWRLTFADGGDDRLVRMSMSQDQVNGFLVTPAF